MRILFFGDIVGRNGRQVVKRHLNELIEKYRIDFVIANGGEVVTIELTKGFSTSILIEKLINK